MLFRSVLAPTVLGGIFWKRSSSIAALCSIVCGEGMMVYMTFINKMAPLGFSAGFWGLLTALIIFIMLSLFIPQKQHIAKVITSIDDFFAEKTENS